MSQNQYPFIFIKNINESHPYTSPQSGGGKPRISSRDRISHGEKLANELNEIWREFQNQEAVSLSSKDGHYLEFRSSAGYDLVTKSLEDIRQGVRLLNVRIEELNGEEITFATVYIPAGKESFFIEKIRAYLEEETEKGNPKNKPLVESIEGIREALLSSFWQDDKSLIPQENPEWCEIWLRVDKEKDVYEEFKVTCEFLEIELEEGVLNFPERLVLLAKANVNQLKELINNTDYLAEIRKGKETIEFIMSLSNIEQLDWVNELLSRLSIDADSKTSIFILDTGINNGHQLLNPILNDNDLHSYDTEWGVSDHNGHGTWMSGVAAFGDLLELLQSNDKVNINHILESGKILPPTGSNDPKLYGYITQQVISLAEINAPDRNRIICMAVTENDADRGRPSSWSGAIDSLCSGAEDEKQRLIILAAGNIKDDGDWKAYPDSNMASTIHSPSQSWNALVVGASTNLIRIHDPNLRDYKAIAPVGGLSPYSTTSLSWESKWPIKPDVLFEGGNAAIDDTGFVTECDDLSVLTTHHLHTTAQFESFNMTSAATAKAAWMAAKIQSLYPDIWPETIKALLIHSAEWSESMKEQFFTGTTDRAKYYNLLRCCGYGVPNIEKAMYCTKNVLTLIAEESIQPFDKKEGGGYRTKDMHFYEIPWPKDTLLELGNTPIKMKVTLTYFIEPSPGEIGWKDRYRYRSHGLKFDVNTAVENKEQFVKRINKAARDEDESRDTSNDSNRWAIGSQSRNLGSSHSDFIEGSATDIATCNYIGVYPVIGWWRERNHLKKWDKKTRYALIVSIETPEIEVDLYTPVAIKMQIPIEV